MQEALDGVWQIIIRIVILVVAIESETKKYVWDNDAEMGGLMKWMDDEAPVIDK